MITALKGTRLIHSVCATGYGVLSLDWDTGAVTCSDCSDDVPTLAEIHAHAEPTDLIKADASGAIFNLTCQHGTSVLIDADSWEQEHRCLDCGATFDPHA